MLFNIIQLILYIINFGYTSISYIRAHLTQLVFYKYMYDQIQLININCMVKYNYWNI